MRPEGYTTADADIDARNHHANEDRKARVRQARWDRLAQTLVALISAIAAIAAAYCAARYGIEKLDGSTPHFAIVIGKAQNAQDVILKLDTRTGRTWTLIKRPKGLAWQQLPL